MTVGVGELPPALIVLAAAVVAGIAPRKLGHGLGVVSTLAVVGLSVVAPEGVIISGALLGFDAIPYAVDAVSRLMGVIFGFIGAAAVVYSFASEAPRVQTAFALAYVGSSLGAVFSGDWLTLVIWWELMAATSTLLVWHYGGAAVRAGFRYALVHGVGGSLVLAAVVWHFAAIGSLAFTPAGIAEGVPAVLAALGIGVNVGFIGLHAWLPDTYPQPHVAASVFLCVYTTKTGVYAMFRAFPDGHLWIAYMGGGMAVFGAFVALLQNDMRRLLSYHIQSQVGYMVAGVGIGTALASAGAFGHVFNHILYKSLLFMTVGVVIYRTGRESLHDVGGLASEMPITAITFFIAALSIAGFPGFNGFVSKGMVTGAAHKEHLDALWYLLMLGGVGTFLSFIKLGYHVFLHGEPSGPVRDSNAGQSVAMVVIAGLCVLFGVYPAGLYGLLPGAGEFSYSAYTLGHIGEGLVLAAAGIVGFAILKRPLGAVGQVPDIDAVYNPLTFRGVRSIAYGVTGVYGAADRAVVSVAGAATRTATDPEAVVRTVPQSDRLIGPPDERHSPLRAGIGAGVLLVVLVITLVLVAVFVL